MSSDEDDEPQQQQQQQQQPRHGNHDDAPAAEPKDKGSSSDDDDDDDSSSSSSGSSSSSSDSDSDSENEGSGERAGAGSSQQSQDGGREAADRKYSIESLTSGGASNGLGSRGAEAAREKANAEPLNVNTNRAAARFREQVSTDNGFMALGTKKRDRRTIEEIQRDLQKKRGRSGTLTSSQLKKPAPSTSGNGPVARPSPPKSSPIMSPESGTEMERISLGLPLNKTAGKGKANSARSRLEKILTNRGGSRPAPASAAKPKKPAAAGGGTATGTPLMTGMVTNISAGKTIKPGNSSSSDHDSTSATNDSKVDRMEPKMEPKIVDSRPDGRVVRSVLRVMLRYGDLTDVHLFPGDHHRAFHDEYKLPNFVSRANLHSTTKTPEDKLLNMACAIADGAQKAIEDQKDSMKYADVEIKPSQVIERLYENLKLRVAVQHALYETEAPPRQGTNAAYGLVAKHYDASILGIGRDFQPWTWAEKEHDWNSKKDAALLIGIYLHGFGAWEDILNDDRLLLQQQRALKGERLKKRAENLLKRLPPPNETGEPKIVALANVLTSSGQNPAHSLGAQFSAIINGSSVKGGRMQRAAERFASRQNNNESTGGASERRPEDSIRKSSFAGNDRPSNRKASVSSPALSSSVRANDDPEDGEVGRETSRSSKRSATEDSGTRRDDREKSPHKKSKKHHSDDKHRAERQRSSSAPPTGKRRRLSDDELLEKWKPGKRLKEIRQVLKKMKIMADWSKNQNDEVVVEKVYKYVTTIGEAIDKIVVDAEPLRQEESSERDWDELCAALWTYAADYTPFRATAFEQLYDDICADGDRLREEARSSSSRRSASS